MTQSQISLMKRCIKAAREAENLDDPYHILSDWEMVEVGWINGVNPRTAQSLVDAGLLVECVPSTASEYTSIHVRLPRADEIT